MNQTVLQTYDSQQVAYSYLLWAKLIHAGMAVFGVLAYLTAELVAVMQARFVDWGLTHSESDVVLLLIKGLSMKQIAEVRGVKEKTVRQQAASIYAKSDCAGRHELVAGFIEDILSEIQ